MAKEIEKIPAGHASFFERIRKINESGAEYWESRELSAILEYTQYRNFEAQKRKQLGRTESSAKGEIE